MAVKRAFTGETTGCSFCNWCDSPHFRVSASQADLDAFSGLFYDPAVFAGEFSLAKSTTRPRAKAERSSALGRSLEISTARLITAVASVR